jgi:glycosyltransferase involved in cell wall biosynthesis
MTLGIVTLSFNQAMYLPSAIESVRVKDQESLSYIMVDPGSRDGSREIIEHHRNRFSAVILESDEGPADGLNKGFARAGGDILGYLNADDVFVDGGLDYVMEYFKQHRDVDVLLGALRVMNGDGTLHRRGRAADRVDLRKFAAGACFFWQQSNFFRREMFERVGGFNVANRISWDSELIVDMALAGARFGYTDRVIGNFRLHAESITGSRQHLEPAQKNLERVGEKIRRAGIQTMSPYRARAARLWYKINPVRHYRSMFRLKLPT